MGFMDKVKAQAEQALTMAQQSVSQGQEKLDSMHARRGVEGLLRDLGAAFYAHQRTGGAPEPVQSALAALDAYAAANGPIDTSPTAIHSTAPATTANTAQAYGGQPDPAAQQYGAPQNGAPQYGAPQSGAPGYAAQPAEPQTYAPPAAPAQPAAPTFNQPGSYRPPSA